MQNPVTVPRKPKKNKKKPRNAETVPRKPRFIGLRKIMDLGLVIKGMDSEIQVFL